MSACARYAWLVTQATLELWRYDSLHAARGFGYLRGELARRAAGARPSAPADEAVLCAAMLLAAALYWKPVLCLQRSFCTVRLLRAHGIAARVVIGYRDTPFFSHAWARVGSRVVNDSSAYERRLRVLHTI
jgi:hypothetical protein